MFPELTSADFERFFKTGKSTIHKHLQDLIEIGIITEPELRDLKGNIICHKDYHQKITNFDKDIDYEKSQLNEQELLKIIQIESSFAKINQASNQILIDFANKVTKMAKNGLNPEILKILREMTQHKQSSKGKKLKDQNGNLISQYELLSSFNYMTKPQYMIFRGEWFYFLMSIKKKFEDLSSTEDNIKGDNEKIMLVTTTGIPMKRMLEFLN